MVTTIIALEDKKDGDAAVQALSKMHLKGYWKYTVSNKSQKEIFDLIHPMR